jgi:5-methylcytosine-specific restriction enzyme A
MITSARITAIRTIPMSGDDLSFKGKSVWEVQSEYFLNYLPSARYLYKKGLIETKDTLVLFQFQARIIAYAILTDNERFNQPDRDGYRGAYYFDPLSICVLREPLQNEDLKRIWSNFTGFSQTMHHLDCSKLEQLDELFASKKRLDSRETFEITELEDGYQRAIDDATWQASGVVTDEPRLPVSVTVENQKRAWVRNILTAKNALMHAQYLCEIDSSHKHFISQATGKNYVEAHHLIPMKFQSKFKFSLDVEANIISLCVVCHNKIHRATIAERKELVSNIFSDRIERLDACRITLKLPELLSFYD